MMENFGSLPPAVQQELLNRPAQEPPQDGSRADDTADGELIGIVLTITFTATVTVLGLMRLYAQSVLAKKLAAADYVGFLSFIPYYATVGVFMFITRQGNLFVHQWAITQAQFLEYLRTLIYFRVTYSLVMLFAKTAILIEWNRIFVLNRTRNLFFWALVTVGVLNIVVSILAIILSVASCVPMQKIWMPWIEGRCFAREAADLVSAWSNLVVDLAIIILPQREIWKLHMPTRRKVGVSLTFSVGLLVCGIAIARTYANMTLNYDDDVAYDSSYVTTICFAEITGVLIVFCVPGVPRIFTQQSVFHDIISSLRSWMRLKESASTSTPKIVPPTPSSWTEYSRPRKSLVPPESDFVMTDIAADKGAAYIPMKYMNEDGFRTVRVYRHEEYVSPYGYPEQVYGR